MRFALALLACSVALAQQPRFEVASARLSVPNGRRSFTGGPGTRDPNRFTATGATMRDLIARAYGVSFFQISGNLAADTYDVSAILPEGTTLPQFQQMLVGLLQERFHLNVRQEIEDFPAYELVIAKSGTKLKESDPNIAIPAPEGFPPVPAGQATWIAQSSRVDGYGLGRVHTK